MHGWACVCVAGISIEMEIERNGSSNVVCICDCTRGKFGQVRLGFWTWIDRSIETHGMLVLQSIDQFIWFILMVFACV